MCLYTNIKDYCLDNNYDEEEGFVLNKSEDKRLGFLLTLLFLTVIL